MNYIDTKTYDIANGTGVRVTIFVAGCPKEPKCPFCFNPETHDFNGGKEFTEEVMNDLLKEAKQSYIKGITLLGGEPLDLRNQKGLLLYVQKFKKQNPEKDVWCFTGFRFEQILNMYMSQQTTKDLLPLIDIIVDGEFIEALKDPHLIFKGSSNQRTIALFDLNKKFDDENSIKEMINRASKEYIYGICLFLDNIDDIDKMKNIIPYLKEYKSNNKDKKITLIIRDNYERIPDDSELVSLIDNIYDKENRIIDTKTKEKIKSI